MTQYHGGKQRIGEYIADIIQAYTSEAHVTGYLEPFCGMLGVYQHIPSRLNTNRLIAGDINKSVILMWKKAQRGWIPPTTITEPEFDELRRSNRSSAVKGFIGHACSHRGIYFAPFCSRTNLTHSSEKVRAISAETAQVEFKHCEYSAFKGLRNYVIYCDPPYYKSSRYYDETGKAIKFDHDAFYRWAENMAKHNLVFISENSKLPYELIIDFESGGERLYLVSFI